MTYEKFTKRLARVGAILITVSYEIFALTLIAFMAHFYGWLGIEPAVDLWLGAAMACTLILAIRLPTLLHESIESSPTLLGWRSL